MRVPVYGMLNHELRVPRNESPGIFLTVLMHTQGNTIHNMRFKTMTLHHSIIHNVYVCMRVCGVCGADQGQRLWSRHARGASPEW